MLRDFIDSNREDIVRRCRAKAARRSLSQATGASAVHSAPLFLDHVVTALGEVGCSSFESEIARRASLHARDLLLQGFTVSQVVHAYGDVCQAVADLAVESNALISAHDFRTLNRCLDDAIAGAVTAYGTGRKEAAGEADARDVERLRDLTDELRGLTETALMALEVLKTGTVGIKGNTGAVLQRSLLATRALIARSIDETRNAQDALQRPATDERVSRSAPVALARVPPQ